MQHEKKFCIKKITLAAVLTGLALCSEAGASFIGEQMDLMYEDIMSNHTDGGAYKTARRGVISGGGLEVRTRLMDIHPVTFEPPSISAGCGGINLFTGSFSFINSEQWIQFARSVASNAVSYAFELALEEMSPAIHSIVSKLQTAANLMNGYQLNSCQLAQGIVNDTVGQVLDNRAKTDASIYSSTLGYFDDYFTARNGAGGDGKSSSIDQIAKNNPELYSKKLGGNIVYNALLEANISGWFHTSVDFRNFAGEFMSVMGTVIVLPEKLPDGNYEQKMEQKIPSLGFRDLVEGNRGHPVTVYQCAADYSAGIPCTSIVTRTVNDFKGLSEKIQDLLIGADRQGGIVLKFTDGANVSSSLSDSEKSIMNLIPEVMVQIRNLAQSGDFALVRDHVIQNADAIGAMAAYNLIDAIYKSTRIALSSSHNTNRQTALEYLDANMESFRREFENYDRLKGGLDSGNLYRSYRDRKNFIDKQYRRTIR